jgi:AcrR family transcriptional regulator
VGGASMGLIKNVSYFLCLNTMAESPFIVLDMPKEDTRSLLIAAAVQLIDQAGEDGLRLQQVAEMVGVSEPSVYHFFRNRTALVEAAQIVRYRRSYYEVLVPFAAAVSLANTRDEFEKAVRKVFALSYVSERNAMRLTRVSVMGRAQSSEVIANAVREINFEVVSELVRVLTDAQVKGWVNKNLDAVALGYWLTGQFTSRVMAELDPGRVSLDEWDKISVEAVIGLFRTEN